MKEATPCYPMALTGGRRPEVSSVKLKFELAGSWLAAWASALGEAGRHYERVYTPRV